MKIIINNSKNSSGQLALQILLYSALAMIFLSGFLVWANAVSDYVIRYSDRFRALEIAEAGIEYYRWHLAHDSGDYQDGTGHLGPYAHDYYDKSGNLIGQFVLDITPPPSGSTIVTIKSTGLVVSDPTISKVVQVKLGIPSYTKYAAAVNAAVRFGQGTEVFGAIHSNGGIRFDGVVHNIVTSALSSYDDPDHSGNNEFGVHTHVNVPPATGVNDNFRPLEAPTSTIMNRSDVFMAGRQFPVPAIDFSGITADLTQMKTSAKSNGFYASSSGVQGYHVVLKTNDTFDLYRVNSLATTSSNCYNSLGQSGWGSWSIRSGGEQLIGNYPFPANNLIFIEDNLWIDGQINDARLTIGSAVFPDNPNTRSSITVNNNLLYTNYDGRDALGLIAQNNFNVGMVSTSTLRIDGAIIAQNGRAGRYYYRSGCSPYNLRQDITLYGMMMSNQRYGFAYTDGTGYQTRNLVYDSNLLYGPPPDFPLTASSYQIISWEEIK